MLYFNPAIEFGFVQPDFNGVESILGAAGQRIPGVLNAQVIITIKSGAKGGGSSPLSHY